MIILGLNAHHADAAACIVVDGKLVAAAEEERFRRIKHWAGFPSAAVDYCLREAGVGINGVDHIAVNRDPNARLMQRMKFILARRPSVEAIRRRLANRAKIKDLRTEIVETFKLTSLKPKLHNVEHHSAHLASACFVSPFEEAGVLSIDGFGDFVSAMWGVARGNRIEVLGEIGFPHSLGIFYTAMTQYLGFPHYGDEYKVMGLAPYGKPAFMPEMRDIVHVKDGRFALNTDYFTHHSVGLDMVWVGGSPAIGPVYSEKLIEKLGPARAPQDPIEQRHKDLAASMQAMFEEGYFALANALFEKTKIPNLALAGGCGYNSVANGLVFDRSPYRELYIQAAAGDAGGAIGAAYWVWNEELRQPRSFVMDHAYWGPEYDDGAVDKAVFARQADLDEAGCILQRVRNERELCARTAEQVAKGNVVGWFQGRMEWGPRALGNRSIVCDPRRADMKDILNQKIKRRESFRPFAPSVIREAVGEWFETDYDVPFMLQVYQIREEKRAQIPAVTHVNGSGRLQSVTESQNARYYHLIEAFREITGVPIVLNTSFNENEPVVNTPAEALDCFLRTKMDLLVMGDLMISADLMTLRRVIAGALRPLLRVVPANARLPILTGPLRGRRWIAGAATHGCWIGIYERDAQRAFVEHIRPGDVVYDVGANAGFFTLLASKLTGSSGAVYAFEPLPRNLELLREHIRLNGAGNVQVVPVALSDRAGVAHFGVASNPAMGSLSDEGALEVRTVRLDELGLPLPSFIKMDIEGGEQAALRGAENLLRAARPTILLSMHGYEQSERCSELLRGTGYHLNVLTDGESDGNYVVLGMSR